MRFLRILILFYATPAFANSGLGLTNGAPEAFSSRRVAQPVQREVNEAPAASSNQQVSGQSGDSVDLNTQNLNNTTGFQNTQRGGMNDANYIKEEGSRLQIQGIAVAGMYMSVCVRPGGGYACPMAAQAAMEAFQSGSASGRGADTARFFDQNGYPTASGGGASSLTDIYNEQAQETLDKLKGMGYAFNEDGSISLPSGEQVSPSELGSMDFLTSQGLSEEAAKKAQQRYAQLGLGGGGSSELDSAGGGSGNAQAANAKQGTAGQAMIGLDGESSSGNIPAPLETIEYQYKKKPKNYRMPASKAAEYSRDFHGTPIGIGLANIFTIVQKKYDQEKNKKTEFINREY